MAHPLRTLSLARLGHHIGHLDDPGIRDDARSAMRTQLDVDWLETARCMQRRFVGRIAVARQTR